MDDCIQDKLLGIINREEVRSLLSTAAAGISVANPWIGAMLGAFKEAAAVADEVKFKHIIRGLASGLDQERFVNELQNYVRSSDEHAYHVVNTIRKGLLSESPIACDLLGRILADHVDRKSGYDQSDVIIVHALGSATDDDLKEFQQMMDSYHDKYIDVTNQNTADWCSVNRLFRQVTGVVSGGTLDVSVHYVPCEAAERLKIYIDEIRQSFRKPLI